MLSGNLNCMNGGSPILGDFGLDRAFDLLLRGAVEASKLWITPGYLSSITLSDFSNEITRIEPRDTHTMIPLVA